jgi:Spy/CpxP family protein refolding chaperone
MAVRRVSFIAASLVVLGGVIALTLPHALLPQPSSSPEPPRSSQGDPSPREATWLKDLNLSRAQLQKIQAIRQKYQPQVGPQREAIRQAQQEFEMVIASEATADQVRQKYRQFRTIKAQLEDTRFESLLEMREVLTPAQRIKFAENMQRRRSKYRDRPPEASREP